MRKSKGRYSNQDQCIDQGHVALDLDIFVFYYASLLPIPPSHLSVVLRRAPDEGLDLLAEQDLGQSREHTDDGLGLQADADSGVQ